MGKPPIPQKPLDSYSYRDGTRDQRAKGPPRRRSRPKPIRPWTCPAPVERYGATVGSLETAGWLHGRELAAVVVGAQAVWGLDQDGAQGTG